VADDVHVEESPVGPVLRTTEDTELAILYLHGEPDGLDPVLGHASELARWTGATVVCPRYRPAFPAALIDAHSGYSYCQAVGQVVVIGERLGAALATAMLVQLRDSEATPPSCAVLLSALLDLTLDTRSLVFNARADEIAQLRRRINEYARGTALTDARLSPLYANLHGLPPMQLLATGTDPLLDDSLAFATRAARSRVPIDLHVWPETASFHDAAIPAIAKFISAHDSTTRA
jgi:acetyl esterase/lipase